MTTDKDFEAQERARFLKSEAEWLANKIGDICEDTGSSNRTLAGIADADKRAKCAKRIARTKRDQELCIRNHFERLAIQKAEQAATDRKYEARRRAEAVVARQRKAEADALRAANEYNRQRPSVNVTPTPKTFLGREIMEKFNRRRTTG